MFFIAILLFFLSFVTLKFWGNEIWRIKYYFFHYFTVHFDSLNFIHTNSCTFSYNHVLVF